MLSRSKAVLSVLGLWLCGVCVVLGTWLIVTVLLNALLTF